MFHQVIQVLPTDDFKVYVYFVSGEIRLYDASFLVKQGVFAPLADVDVFKSTCTVLNRTLAWDIAGNYDAERCLDIDPETLFLESVSVSDPLSVSA